ncbi:MAG: tetratricopeptide repeat protein [Chthoniobacterales bacterium]
MRVQSIVKLITITACISFSVRARSQDMGATNLGDFLGKDRASRTTSYDERRRLVGIYDNGIAAHRSKQYDRAISAFTTLLQSQLEAKAAAVVYVARAQSYAGKGELRKAMADATEAIKLDRDLAIAYNTRGVAFGRMGDFNNAIKDFDAALRLDPRLMDAQRNRALAQRYLNQRSGPKPTSNTR